MGRCQFAQDTAALLCKEQHVLKFQQRTELYYPVWYTCVCIALYTCVTMFTQARMCLSACLSVYVTFHLKHIVRAVSVAFGKASLYP